MNGSGQHDKLAAWDLSGAAAFLAVVLLCGCGEANVASQPGLNTQTNMASLKQKEEVRVKENRSGSWTPELSEEEKNTLFAIVTDTLGWCVNGGKGKFSFDSYSLTPKLKVPTATFVTLKIGERLRGCIGSLAPEEAMYMSVHHNAINASLRDWRFSPVPPGELSRIDVHVSLLSPIRDIPSFKDFKLGQQGIILEKRGRRAVFLPEVALEQNWTVEDTLSQLSLKAGLDENAWREGAKFQVFESVVLSK